MVKGFVLASTALSLSMMIATAPAAAQQADATTVPAPAGSAAPPPATTLDQGEATTTAGVADIIVTAQRRSENLQRAPIAVSAVSGQALVSANITKPYDLAVIVPALQTTATAGPYALFYLRGIGTFTGNTLSDSPVAFNYNGVYIGRTSGASGFFYDLDRVEVVKGPQGILYGRNATGGAVNLLPVGPKLGDTSGYATFAYGNYETVQANVAANLPLGEKMAIRAAGFYAKHDPYLNDGTDDQDDYGARLSLLAVPTDNLRITLVGDYSHNGGTGVGAVVINQGAGNRFGLNSSQAGAYFQSQPNSVAGHTFSPLDGSGLFQHNRQAGISANIEWTNPLGTLTVLPAYRYTHNNFLTDAPGFYLSENQRFSQTSVEVRLASDETHALRYIVGGYFFHEPGKDDQYVNAQSQAQPQKFSTLTDSKAVFGQLTYAVTDTLKLEAGGRYTHDHKTFNGTDLGANKLCLGAILPPFTGTCPLYTPLPNGGFPALTFPPGSNSAIPLFDFVQGTITVGNRIIANEQQNYNKFTYKLGASWQVTPRNLLYANYSTGYKSGGFFFSADTESYRPETIKAWTVGSKNRFLDGKLQLNLEGFYYKYSNEQISHVTQDSTGNTIFATDNVGKATFKGFEAETQIRPFLNTLLSADVQYLDASYDSFVYSAPISVAPVTSCRQTPNATFTTVVIDCSGKRPINAPKWTVGLGAEQTIPLSAGPRIVIGGRVHIQSRTATGLEFTPIEYQRSYAIGDVYARLEIQNGKYTLEGFVNNIGDLYRHYKLDRPGVRQLRHLSIKAAAALRREGWLQILV